MRRWSEKIKQKARSLRKNGCSYGVIIKELNVPKSTLYEWIHHLKQPEQFNYLDRVQWAKKIQPLGAQAQREKRKKAMESVFNKVTKEVSNVELNTINKKAMLAMLYWAEGTKGKVGGVTFANTDPQLLLLFVTLLRQCYEIDEKRIRVRLHLHYYHKIRVVRKYWSQLLNIPENQFNKTYKKSRQYNKRIFRRNFGGICFVKYNSLYLKEEILQYGYTLGKKLTRKIYVPVA